MKWICQRIFRFACMITVSYQFCSAATLGFDSLVGPKHFGLDSHPPPARALTVFIRMAHSAKIGGGGSVHATDMAAEALHVRPSASTASIDPKYGSSPKSKSGLEKVTTRVNPPYSENRNLHSEVSHLIWSKTIAIHPILRRCCRLPSRQSLPPPGKCTQRSAWCRASIRACYTKA